MGRLARRRGFSWRLVGLGSTWMRRRMARLRNFRLEIMLSGYGSCRCTMMLSYVCRHVLLSTNILRYDT
jgi:hypothetical protein